MVSIGISGQTYRRTANKVSLRTHAKSKSQRVKRMSKTHRNLINGKHKRRSAKCRRCNGTGHINRVCEICNGVGWNVCCKYTGKEWCPSCGGTGRR